MTWAVIVIVPPLEKITLNGSAVNERTFGGSVSTGGGGGGGGGVGGSCSCVPINSASKKLSLVLKHIFTIFLSPFSNGSPLPVNAFNVSSSGANRWPSVAASSKLLSSLCRWICSWFIPLILIFVSSHFVLW